jgi:hypothetical protein
MKIFPSLRQRTSGQILAEACNGLSLMVFVWIIITYSLYLANYQIRAEMAARYAAWYQGNNNGTAATAAQLDQYFFFQGGLSTVTPQTADGIVDALAGINNTNTSSSYASGDGSGGNGPFKVQVTFGVSSLNSSTNPYPFSMVSSDLKIPFMPSSTFSLTSVNATCQWDGDSDTWNSWTSAGEGIWNTISSEAGSAGSFFSSLF